MRERSRQDLLYDVLEDWELLLRCHVGRQDLRLGDQVGHRGDSILSQAGGVWTSYAWLSSVIYKVKDKSRWKWGDPSWTELHLEPTTLNCAVLTLIHLKEIRNYIL